ncbi:type-F conjugative transfer system pilin assembly protein TrbC [Sphingobium yanoikuyae]|nr:type-F conjugative transfer system pilin assembly protein TrbC [Sphingobium yanoikuyae]
MPISKPSLLDRAVLGTLLAMMSSAQLHAQSPISREGDAALERLKGALRDRPIPTDHRLHELPLMEQEDDGEIRAMIGRRPSSQELDVRAREALDRGQAVLGEQREAMSERLNAALGLSRPKLPGELQPELPGSGATGWVPVLFVSSSMPISTLRTYAAQLMKVRGVMAFRGVPGGLTHIGPMAKLTAEILRTDPGCEGPACMMRDVQIVVDPILFRQHAVSRVPALGMIGGDPTQPYCERDEESGQKASHLVFGDAALSGLLEEYGRLGGKEEVRHASALLAGR